MPAMNKHQKMARTGRSPYAKGGKVHDDAAQDRALIREEIDKAMPVKKAKGGKVKC